MISDFLCALASGVIGIIILEVVGYDVGYYGLPWWFWIIALALFFVHRGAWGMRKSAQP
jgi:hypothetical protein